MTFTTLKYEYLKNNILNLEKSYSNYLERYTIIDNSTENSLQVLISRINTNVIQCKTERKTAQKVFSQLTTELRPFITGTSEVIKNATLFLLGALVHRYFRLIIEYNDYNKSIANPAALFQVKLWDVTTCRFFKAVVAALQSDKRVLDELTIVSALEVFRENMFLEVAVEETKGKTKKTLKIPRYMTYEHFAVDPHFKHYLDELIKKHQKLGATVIKQFKAIFFLQSIANQLEKEKEPVEKEITEWCHALSKEHQDFSKLTPEEIERHLHHYFKLKPEKDTIKERILDLLAVGYESKKFAAIKDYSAFLELMNTCNTDEGRCILCGGYVLLVQRGNLDNNLLTLMEKALGLQTELSYQDKLDCINILQPYIEKEPGPDLNCEFFGTRGHMVTEVSQLSVALEQIVKEHHRSSVENVLRF